MYNIQQHARFHLPHYLILCMNIILSVIDHTTTLPYFMLGFIYHTIPFISNIMNGIEDEILLLYLISQKKKMHMNILIPQRKKSSLP